MIRPRSKTTSPSIFNLNSCCERVDVTSVFLDQENAAFRNPIRSSANGSAGETTEDALSSKASRTSLCSKSVKLDGDRLPLNQYLFQEVVHSVQRHLSGRKLIQPHGCLEGSVRKQNTSFRERPCIPAVCFPWRRFNISHQDDFWRGLTSAYRTRLSWRRPCSH